MENIVEKLLNPNSDISDINEEDQLSLLAQSLEFRENYQKILGRIASEYSKKHDAGQGRAGKKIMATLADQLENMTGIKVSPNTLTIYRQVWDRIGSLGVPPEWSFRVWRTLVRVDNPKEWIQKAEEQGWSGSQLHREISLFKGDSPQKTKCPFCGMEI